MMRAVGIASVLSEIHQELPLPPEFCWGRLSDDGCAAAFLIAFFKLEGWPELAAAFGSAALEGFGSLLSGKPALASEALFETTPGTALFFCVCDFLEAEVESGCGSSGIACRPEGSSI